MTQINILLTCLRSQSFVSSLIIAINISIKLIKPWLKKIRQSTCGHVHLLYTVYACNFAHTKKVLPRNTHRYTYSQIIIIYAQPWFYSECAFYSHITKQVSQYSIGCLWVSKNQCSPSALQTCADLLWIMKSWSLSCPWPQMLPGSSSGREVTGNGLV